VISVIETISLLPTGKEFATKEMSLITGDTRFSSFEMIETLRWMKCVKLVTSPKPRVQTIWQKAFDPNDHIFSSKNELIEFCNVCKYRKIKTKQPDCIIFNRYKSSRNVWNEYKLRIEEDKNIQEKK